MLGEIITYYAYNERAATPLPVWMAGTADGAREHHAELFDVSCPACDTMLLIVSYPTIAETKAEAARGNPRAFEDIPGAGDRKLPAGVRATALAFDRSATGVRR